MFELNAEMTVALISVLFSLMASIFTLWGKMQIAKLQIELEEKRDAKLKKQELEALLSKYREPLINAAYELQGRLFNILQLNFMRLFYEQGDVREQQYAIENTLYVIAQYLGWSEIIRQEIQFLDLGELETTKELTRLQDQICNLFLDSKLGKMLRIFRGEQRAIGEKMLIQTPKGSHCMGYARFIETTDPHFQYWFEPLRLQLRVLANDVEQHRNKLIGLQHGLVDLIDFLDPNDLRYPKEKRQKVGLSSFSHC